MTFSITLKYYSLGSLACMAWNYYSCIFLFSPMDDTPSQWLVPSSQLELEASKFIDFDDIEEVTVYSLLQHA